jgi:hypothetical protein
MHPGAVDHGARSPEQGPRVGSQHDQGPRSRARQPSSRLWTWQRKAIDVSSHISRGGDEHSKSCAHLLLGGTLIDTHSSVLTRVAHTVLCDTFPPFLDFAHTVMDNTTYYEKRCVCVCDGHLSTKSSPVEEAPFVHRPGTGASHLQPSCLFSAPYKLTVCLFPHCLFTLSTVHVHSACGPPSRIGIAGSRYHFCRCSRLGRSLIHL